MKKTNLIIFLFVLLISCSNQDAQKQVIISGNADIADATGLVISNKTDTFKIDIDSAHVFHDTILADRGYYTLSINERNFRIYLKPGFQIDIKIGNSIEFKGEGSIENSYLIANNVLVDKLKEVDNYKYYAKRKEEPFLLLMDSIFQTRLNLLNEIENKVCHEFEYLEKSKLKYEYQRKKALYETGRQIVVGDNDFTVSENYYANLFKDINVNDSILINVNDYIRFVSSYLWQETNSIVGDNDSIDFYLTYMHVLNKKIEAKNLKERLSYDVGSIKLARTKALDPVYELVLQNLSNEKYLKRVQTQYNTLKRIEKGAMSPDFQFEDVHGNMVELKDLRGKIVYIDIWSTGCGPCMAEIPYQKRLEEYCKGKNIYLVGINILDDAEHWKKTVTEKKLGGIQLHTSDERDKFFTDYVVRGIPRYILVDENGRIIDSSAKRPSDEKLIEQLDKIM
ncbi:TlpA family protein disulfide reductase [Maribellus comscasis]|nr:TlpA disulfide reductase family protein [Maribellus comscasis]